MFSWRRSMVGQRLAGAVLALLLTLFVASPALDHLVCHGDEAAVAAVHHAQGDKAESGHSDDGSGPCVHGHVHAVACEAPAYLAFAEPAEIDARAPVTRGRAVGLWRTIGQERPPRA